MNTLAQIQPSRAAIYSAQQLALIRRTVAADCNESEFDLFIEVCRRIGLDPFRKQIYAVVYNKTNNDKRKMSIITGIDGFRAVAARNRDYRPDNDEPQFTTDETFKGEDNPLGIVKCTIKAYKLAPDGQWHKVSGTAYWSEFAVIKEDPEDGYDWIETGEVWSDSGKPKKKRVPRGEIHRVPEGMWATMPHVMLAKCAEAQALRKGWPEDLSGIYAAEEMEQASAADQTASAAVEQFQSDQRLKSINAADAITMDMQDGSGALVPVKLGQFADKVIERAGQFSTAGELRFFMDYNRAGLQEFWARRKGDALGLKTELEKIAAGLSAKEAQQAAE